MSKKNIDELLSSLNNRDSLYLFNKLYYELNDEEMDIFNEYKIDKLSPIWKRIEIDGINLKHPYEISNTGIIRRFINIIKGYRYLYGQTTTNGYRAVDLACEDNTAIKKFIHRLVANAFIPNPENKPEVNHINGNKQCNWYKNLEWVTPKENIQHAIMVGLHKPFKNYDYNNQKRGEENGRSKYKEIDVRNVCKLLEEGKKYKEISKILNISKYFVESLIKGHWENITKDYNIPIKDSLKNKSIRSKIIRLINKEKILSLENIKNSFITKLDNSWDKYILYQIEKYLNSEY